jgi:hemoglobin-like flavoprotein
MNIELMFSKSVKILKNQHDHFADQFYIELFKTQPKLKKLFKNSNIESQKEELYDGIEIILENINNPNFLIPYLHDLGMRHSCYGVEVKYYPFACEAMMMAMKNICKDIWYDELNSEWEYVLEMITSHMEDGSKLSKKAV